MVHKAILKINPNAQFTIIGDDINTCEIKWHNGTAEISKSDIKSKLIIVEQEIIDAETTEVNKKASGKAKLKALGLDDEELKTLGL